MERKALTDPLEQLIEDALEVAGVRYVRDVQTEGPDGPSLDFYIPLTETYIEVTRAYTPRKIRQLGSAENVILLQGERAVRAFAILLRQAYD